MARIALPIIDTLAVLSFIALLLCAAAADKVGVLPAVACAVVLAGAAGIEIEKRRKEDE